MNHSTLNSTPTDPFQWFMMSFGWIFLFIIILAGYGLITGGNINAMIKTFVGAVMAVIMPIVQALLQIVGSIIWQTLLFIINWTSWGIQQLWHQFFPQQNQNQQQPLAPPTGQNPQPPHLPNYLQIIHQNAPQAQQPQQPQQNQQGQQQPNQQQSGNQISANPYLDPPDIESMH